MKYIFKNGGVLSLALGVALGSFGFAGSSTVRASQQINQSPSQSISQTNSQIITPQNIQICIRTSGLAFVVGYGFRKNDCRKNDKLVTISTSANTNGDGGNTGGAGAVGPQGPIGGKGPIGDKGPTGDKGQQGDRGPVGATGATGLQGPQGIPGERGEQGPQGLPGVNGTNGSNGANGESIVGPAGPQGLKGDTGDVGTQGPEGAVGVPGIKGDKGDPGEAGGVLNVMRVMALPTVYTEPSAGTGTTAAGAQVSSVATCPAGSFLLGGGAEVVTNDTGKEKVALSSSYPSDVYNWSATATEIADLTAGKTMSLSAYAICTVHQ